MSRRRSIYIEGFSHENPIPAGCILDNVLMSGIIYGLDPQTGKAASTMEEQCRLMFRHIRNVLSEAGASPDDLIKLNVQLLDRSQREALNEEWTKLFPDPSTRPVRQAMQANLTGGKLIQCDFIAVLESEDK